MPYILSPLPYAFDALEPYIDARTMEIHHDKHHATYVTNLNNTLTEHADLQKGTVEDLLKKLNNLPETIRTAVRNNGGGVANHDLFWKQLKAGIKEPSTGDLATAINSTFGSFAAFKEQFTKAGLTRFGSGWAWLIFGKDGKLAIMSTANQDSPLTDGNVPLLTCDVWEHAYYLKYQNRRADYLGAFWNVVNWDDVAARFDAAKR
jgi:superoxide dismutase, Fe-Mn family